MSIIYIPWGEIILIWSGLQRYSQPNKQTKKNPCEYTRDEYAQNSSGRDIDNCE
jgi:hypothetical protein